MPQVSITTEEVLAADAALQGLTTSGERLPPQLAVSLARLHRTIRAHAGDARVALQGYVDQWGARVDGQLQAAATGGVVIAPEHHAAFREAETQLMAATHDVDAPTLRIADWPAHAAPTYSLVAALLPFLADAEPAPAPSGA